jgi:Flp pilus assembly protein TadG
MRLFHRKISSSPGDKKRLGAAVAEFAFVAPILALVLMGMIELCRGIMVKVTLSDAARKGCRTGIQRDRGNNDTTSAGITSGIISDCTNIMRDNGFDSTKFNPPGKGSIAITVTDPNGNVLPDSLDAPPGSIISVQVSIPVSSTTWVPNVFLPNGSLESETVVMMKQ